MSSAERCLRSPLSARPGNCPDAPGRWASPGCPTPVSEADARPGHPRGDSNRDSNATTHRATGTYSDTRDCEAWTHRPVPRSELIRMRSLGANVGATRANYFLRWAYEYGQADGAHARQRTDPDDAERLTGIYGLEGLCPPSSPIDQVKLSVRPSRRPAGPLAGPTRRAHLRFPLRRLQRRSTDARSKRTLGAQGPKESEPRRKLTRRHPSDAQEVTPPTPFASMK